MMFEVEDAIIAAFHVAGQENFGLDLIAVQVEQGEKFAAGLVAAILLQFLLSQRQ